jgi:DNA-binding HxlR family transcriptional regulator
MTASRKISKAQACSTAMVRAFGILGKRWNGVIIATLMQAPGPMGFAELKRALAGISDSMLSDRLSELCHNGLALRSVDAGPPVAVHYHLSESGRGLASSLRALEQWAERNLPCDG